MDSLKFLLLVAIQLILFNCVFNSMNSCSSLGDNEPTNSTQCTKDRINLKEQEKCCFISANIDENTKKSACILLVDAKNETTIENAAKSLGYNSTYDCSSRLIIPANVIAFICLFLFY